MLLAVLPMATMAAESAYVAPKDETKDGTLPTGVSAIAPGDLEVSTSLVGGGTAESPYEIWSLADFRYLQTLIAGDSTYLTKCYKQMGNIIFNDKLDADIYENGLPSTSFNGKDLNHMDPQNVAGAAYSAIQGTFSGTYDGNGYGIYNAFAAIAPAKGSTVTGYGLFDTVSGTVRNVNLYGGYLRLGKISNGKNNSFGTLVGKLNGGTVENCYSSMAFCVSGTQTLSYAGGLIGSITGGDGTVTGSTYAGYLYMQFSGNDNSTAKQSCIGGITGRVETNATITDCTNRGTISGIGSRVGGIVGFVGAGAFTCTIENAKNYGTLATTQTKVAGGIGGIVGVQHMSTAPQTLEILNSQNRGTITGTTTVTANGILGDTTNAAKATTTITNCSGMGRVSGQINLDGASLAIGGNVTLKLFVKEETVTAAGITDLATITLVNGDGDAVATGVKDGANWVFTVNGLKASDFATNQAYYVRHTTTSASATTVDSTEVLQYSPLQYAINMYDADDNTETVTDLDQLLVSIVNYADAAANTTDASTAFKAAHADADLTPTPSFDTIAKDAITGTYDAATMPQIAANLSESISLTVYLNDTYTGVTAKIGGETLEGTVNGESVTFDFYATDLYNEIQFTFKGGESDVTATYSLVQFLSSYMNGENAALATATAQYLYAARNFCLNNQPNA